MRLDEDMKWKDKFLPVRLTSRSNLTYSISVPAKHWREGPYEREGPDEQQTKDGVLRLQSDITQGSTDHKKTLEWQNGQRPHGYDAYGKDQGVSVKNTSSN